MRVDHAARDPMAGTGGGRRAARRRHHEPQLQGRRRRRGSRPAHRRQGHRAARHRSRSRARGGARARHARHRPRGGALRARLPRHALRRRRGRQSRADARPAAAPAQAARERADRRAVRLPSASSRPTRRRPPQRGIAPPPAYDARSRSPRRIEAARGGAPLAPCHNDLLAANFIHDGARLWIVDWEYAGMGDPFFDLANFAVNNELDEDGERALLAAYGTDDVRALTLMRFMSDFREAMWGVVQQGISELDFDFVGYALEHFERLAAHGCGRPLSCRARQLGDVRAVVPVRVHTRRRRGRERRGEALPAVSPSARGRARSLPPAQASKRRARPWARPLPRATSSPCRQHLPGSRPDVEPSTLRLHGGRDFRGRDDPHG